MGFWRNISDAITFLGELSEHMVRHAHRTGALDMMDKSMHLLHKSMERMREKEIRELEFEHRKRILRKKEELLDTLIKAISEQPDSDKAEIIKVLLSLIDNQSDK